MTPPEVARPRATRFQSRATFRPAGAYFLLPFRFQRFGAEEVLLVNEVGEHLFVPTNSFDRFVRHELAPDDPVYLDLKGRHFLGDSNSTVPLELLATKARTKRAHLAGFTKLHIFVVTLRCEHSCHYCQVSRVTQDRLRYDMSAATASRAVEFAFRAPAETIKIEFQGGEPLLNFDRIVQIVRESRDRATRDGRQVEFVVASNLSQLTDPMLEFFRAERVSLSVSLDGPAHIHNANRPRPGGNSYELTLEGITRARVALGQDCVAALMTTTRLSLDHPRAIVDEYVAQDFHAIFLRSLSPFGFARRTAARIGYQPGCFEHFYTKALDRILEVNRAGYHLVEIFAQILLTRMFTPFSTGYVGLQSPAGTGIGVAVYNYDGDVYAWDEGRMLAETGDTRFRLGNLHRDSYETIFGGETLRGLIEASCVESTPGCADCAFHPWCGSDPVFAHATQGTVVPHIPSSEFHHKHDFVIRHLLERYRSDKSARRIFWSWIRGIPVSELFPETHV
jgi:His-Xaa-Ser system radical SAM maturase HxsB